MGPAVFSRMYVLTIRDGLQTRLIGPYDTTQQAADQLEQLLGPCPPRVHWQIHQLESPVAVAASLPGPQREMRSRNLAA